jgi:sec-independent protein translocase protein TatB
MTPKAVITKHLLDGDDSILTGNFDKPGQKSPASNQLGAGERPPIDTDAT